MKAITRIGISKHCQSAGKVLQVSLGTVQKMVELGELIASK